MVADVFLGAWAATLPRASARAYRRGAQTVDAAAAIGDRRRGLRWSRCVGLCTVGKNGGAGDTQVANWLKREPSPPHSRLSAQIPCRSADTAPTLQSARCPR